ncbi:MAG: hypothetical protein EHM85_02895 [Desulfobacteraceae bacterium]|nr:MAG: hypothetical protein EHM85_02895 [Desulfobacteraceae bacterium]
MEMNLIGKIENVIGEDKGKKTEQTPQTVVGVNDLLKSNKAVKTAMAKQLVAMGLSQDSVDRILKQKR